MAWPQMFADDFLVGERFPGNRVVLSTEAFKEFADLTGDAHPIHYDPEYASRTAFKRPVAHGLLLTSLTALGATELSRSLEESMVALIHQSFDFLKPAFVGDIVESQFQCEAVEPSRQSELCKVTFRVVLVNQQQDILIKGQHKYLLRNRPRPLDGSVS